MTSNKFVIRTYGKSEFALLMFQPSQTRKWLRRSF